MAEVENLSGELSFPSSIYNRTQCICGTEADNPQNLFFSPCSSQWVVKTFDSYLVTPNEGFTHILAVRLKVHFCSKNMLNSRRHI